MFTCLCPIRISLEHHTLHFNNFSAFNSSLLSFHLFLKYLWQDNPTKSKGKLTPILFTRHWKRHKTHLPYKGGSCKEFRQNEVVDPLLFATPCQTRTTVLLGRHSVKSDKIFLMNYKCQCIVAYTGARKLFTLIKLVFNVCMYIWGFRARQHLRSLSPVMNDENDNDVQMIFGDLGGLKLPDICLTVEEKPRKKPHPETCPDRGSNPGPLRDRCTCYHLAHSGGLYIYIYIS